MSGGLGFFVRLRYAAALCFALAVFLGPALGLELATWPMLALVAVVPLSNLWLSRQSERPALIALMLVADTSVLTGLLALSGGPANPFSVLYLVHVSLGVVMLPSRLSWLITALAALGFGLLFFLGPHDASHGFSLHLQGMWLAFALAAALITLFVGRLARALGEREREVARLREITLRHERLAALTTLAAGAAHELATPLATVAVVAKEIERQAAAPGLQEDARLIRRELDRCRHILDEMAAQAGAQAGEQPEQQEAEELVRAVREALSPDRAARLDCVPAAAPILAPPRALRRALLNLLNNAFDASPPEGRVALAVEHAGGRVRFRVQDRGAGMSAEVLAHAAEPFFTTKEPGRGLGLGLFLADRLARSLGGSLSLSSGPGEGTEAILELPARPEVR